MIKKSYQSLLLISLIILIIAVVFSCTEAFSNSISNNNHTIVLPSNLKLIGISFQGDSPWILTRSRRPFEQGPEVYELKELASGNKIIIMEQR